MSFHKKLLHHSKKLFTQAKQKISESKKEEEKKSMEFSLPTFFPPQKSEQKIIAEISLMSAIKIIAVVFGIIILGEFLQATAEIIISFFLALFFSAAIFPGVEFLESKKIPRPLAIAILLFSVIGVFIFLFSNLLPALIEQFIALGQWIFGNMKLILNGDFSPLPEFSQKYGKEIQHSLETLDEYIKNIGTDSNAQKGIIQIFGDNIDKIDSWKNGISSFLGNFFSFLSQLILILLLSFFILFDRESLKSFFLGFFSPTTREYSAKKASQMQEKITQWIHGQMILFMFMGGITWIVLTLLGVEYALTLGFLTGIAEFIPYLGPFIAFLVSTPIAFGSGAETGFAVMIFFMILQLLEGNILVPIVMKKAAGVPPLVTILAMLIGFEFLDVIGAVLAIPVASIIGIFILDIQQKEHEIFKEICKKSCEDGDQKK